MKIISRYFSYALNAGVTIEIYTMVTTHHRIYLYADINWYKMGIHFFIPYHLYVCSYNAN